MKTESILSPSAIIDIYNNSISSPYEHQSIKVKGLYKLGSNTTYGGMFYDALVEESNEIKITLKTNQIHRNKLYNNKLATIEGVLNRRIRNDSTIAISINVTNVLIVEEKLITEDELKRSKIVLSKVEKGFNDPDKILKTKIYKNSRPKVALVFAEGTIVENEFNNALAFAIDYIDFNRTYKPFSNVENLVSHLLILSKSNDVIALIRGGGLGKDIFDSNLFNEKILAVNIPIISAIGHHDEMFLFKKVADKVIDTPTALGSYFKNICEEYISEIAQSKSVLASQIETQYKSQITLLQNNLNSFKLNSENTLKNYELLERKYKQTENELILVKQNQVDMNEINRLNDQIASMKKLIIVIVIIFLIIIFFMKNA
jgi:hypothetical protein